MPRVAIISDLHLKHWHRVGLGHALEDNIRKEMEREKPDFLIDAGDLEDSEHFFPVINEVMNGDFHTVKGNHDYYRKTFYSPEDDCHTIETRMGMHLLATTLWTDCGAHMEIANMVQEGMLDFKLIRQWTPSGERLFTAEDMIRAHAYQKKWLIDEFEDSPFGAPDIVATHHSPTFKSCHPKWRRTTLDEVMCYGFHSHLDYLVEMSKAQLWVHGHTHDDFDYMLSDTRVVCHPCGYPGENYTDPRDYKPVYVELEP